MVENVTVNAVAEAVVTVPTAPLSKVTVLLAAVVSNPYPLIATVVAFAAIILVVAAVTTGFTFAICTAVPLVSVLVVTMAVRLPASAGSVENVTVRSVAVAEVTVPTALLLNTTVLFAAAGSKPKPLITTVAEFAARLAVLTVTTGDTVATCTGEPLTTEFVATTAVKGPAVVGLVESVTVRAVAVAELTVPTAPSLKVTTLFAAVVLKPKPLIVKVVAVARMALEVVAVMTGITVAT